MTLRPGESRSPVAKSGLRAPPLIVLTSTSGESGLCVQAAGGREVGSAGVEGALAASSNERRR